MTTSSRLIKADGTQSELQPANGQRFTFEELEALVGGVLEFFESQDGVVVGWKYAGPEEGTNEIAGGLTNHEIFGHAVLTSKSMLPDQEKSLIRFWPMVKR